MSEDELLNALKSKGLPTFGTKSERSERLKKHFGLSNNNDKKDKVVTSINKIQKQREERRAEN